MGGVVGLDGLDSGGEGIQERGKKTAKRVKQRCIGSQEGKQHDDKHLQTGRRVKR